MMQVRRSQDRGHANHGWLKAKHSFSFADYYDPENMGFSVLRVINEDRVAGGNGFGAHPHRDMEIITYIIDGALEHKDSMGNTAVIKPGEVQTMSAGTGVTHSEWNHLEDQETHLLQIWLLPREQKMKPGYGQKSFDKQIAENDLVLVASRDGRDGSILIHQDVDLFVSKLKADRKLEFKLGSGRKSWIQVISGELKVGTEKLHPGDGLAVVSESVLKIESLRDAHFLLFDLP